MFRGDLDRVDAMESRVLVRKPSRDNIRVDIPGRARVKLSPRCWGRFDGVLLEEVVLGEEELQSFHLEAVGVELTKLEQLASQLCGGAKTSLWVFGHGALDDGVELGRDVQLRAEGAKIR